MPNRWAAINRTAVSFRALLSGAVAHERRAGAIERIERGMNARGTERGSSQRCLNPYLYGRFVVLGVVPSAWFDQAQLSVSYQRICHMPHLGSISVLPPNTPL